jgi:hypothetical protein
VRRLGLKGNMARPLVVVHSGRTTIEESGFSSSNVDKETRRASLEGVS